MEHGAHADHADHSGNKPIAILISLLAAVLAITETAGKSAQTEYLSQQVEASNLWAFYQAKTIRRTVLIGAADRLQLDRELVPNILGAGEAMDNRVTAWRKDIDRWETEPETGEGRRELTTRAQEAEKKRDLANTRYHHYEYGSAALQLAIVLASASIVTGVVLLTWAAAGLGVIGALFALFGAFFPVLV
ncbi:MAG TPA: DUF4337 domain-containing protein [Alphaproteobacteria bacterium]|nr:DUF4337 domain-containing protein [Alphaproteobacteria bacterium]